MKKYLKVMLVLVVALSLLCTFAFATNSFDFGGNATGTTATTAVKNIGRTVVNIVQTLGYVIAVVMVLVVGIQWLMGTPAKKQELKGKLVNVVIGAILIVAGVTILGFIEKVATEAETDLITVEGGNGGAAGEQAGVN